MSLKKYFLSAFIAFLSCFTLLLAESESQPPLENLEAKASKKYSGNQSSSTFNGMFRNTWTPYFTRTCNVQPKRATFFQGNVAMGLLYFSGVEGNLAPNSNFWIPLSTGASIAQVSVKTNRKIQGRLNYNRTPLYELVFGYQWNNTLKTGLSFQAQSNISVFSQSQIISVLNNSFNGTATQGQFFSDLNLYALAFKAYLTFPFSLVVKMVSMTPYLSAGIGPCWQTWKRLTVSYSLPVDPKYGLLDLNQKISANAFFTMDLGFSTTWLIKNKVFKLVKGTRFNIWGQARSMGQINNQTFTSERGYLLSPLRVKTVYQFAPYLGLTFDF